MQLAMMPATKRNCELITDFEAQCARLGKAQVVRIGRMTAANKAWLRSDKPQVGFIAPTFGLGQGEHALVDLGARSLRHLRRKRWRGWRRLLDGRANF